ncbi:MAG: FHA domain-containing protein [Verrucomicrobia bacterium]|nr:FHA domain-containing protein [Verrucomicrobiota bacterium]MCG2679038.1 FHA domain-containing protein [Kiritimatiellia bacterium]MBU4247846.1 FHA domain-containing protein [Verrucomicrobiota bacterium]MBU4291655.1 FHA domain-containing protein [Verrucomicrobiota bacterium]MBU4427826.1 FHA domain-containing protein [Verrucomicrobiota bacterium]
MILRYILPDGIQKEFELGEKPVTIGRGADVDISIPDKMASRVHCGISYWDDAYFIRDFKSRNSTFLNDKQIEISRLNPGDRIRIGDTTLTLESQPRKGTETVIKEVKEEMAKGKGYHTILQDIIREEEKQ